MIVKGDDGPTMEAPDLFSLKLLKTNNDVSKIIDQNPDQLAESEDEEDKSANRRKFEKYSKGEDNLDSSGLYYKNSDSELEMETDEESEDAPEGLGKYD